VRRIKMLHPRQIHHISNDKILRSEIHRPENFGFACPAGPVGKGNA
jgi:hypothetical protein